MCSESLQGTRTYEKARQKSGENGQFAWKEETLNWEKQRKTGVGNQDSQRNPRTKKEPESRAQVCSHRTSPRGELDMWSPFSCLVKPPRSIASKPSLLQGPASRRCQEENMLVPIARGEARVPPTEQILVTLWKLSLVNAGLSQTPPQ